MATHASENPGNDDVQYTGASRLLTAAGVVAVIGIGGAAAMGIGGTFMFRRFLFGYLAAFAFVLALALGSLSIVLMQHLTRAAWSVGVRRTAENLAGTLPLLAVLALPLVISIASGNGYLYRWALPMDRASDAAREAAAKGEPEVDKAVDQQRDALSHPVPVNTNEEVNAVQDEVAAPDPSNAQLDPLVLIKRNYGLRWLNPWFAILRVVAYFVLWIGIVRWFRKWSIEQDRTGDPALTLKLQGRAAPALAILALTATGFAFDMLMSLDPHFYSTMFGVYYITNGLLGGWAILIVTVFLLQRFGYLGDSITIEHYHDLGKYLFAFTFFYGYIAFSQYMLLWYSNIPEETVWYTRHGASGMFPNGWSDVITLILFGHFLIPFGALLSRHVKRRPAILVFWAVWQLVFIAIDMYWIVMPEIGQTGPQADGITVNILAVVGVLGAFFAAFAWQARGAALRPLHDPRLSESVVFQNI